MYEATLKGTYKYDGFGRRISTVGTDGVNRITVYSQDGKVMYGAVSGATTGTKYIYLHNHLIAESSPTYTQYDHTDGLGSPVAITNDSKAVVSRTRYEPYGATAAGTSPSIGFTGHVNAADIGLVYMQQRYYDPMAARLLSVDPVLTSTSNGSSFNRYIYANNNPYRYIDPDGRESASLQACLGFCLGGTVGYNRTSGEFAFTLDIGAGGLGGGLTVDPSASNGRMENLRPNSPQAVAGVTAAGYAKVSATIATPAGSLGAEAKAGWGKDLKTGAVVRAKELNFLLGEGAKGFMEYLPVAARKYPGT